MAAVETRRRRVRLDTLVSPNHSIPHVARAFARSVARSSRLEKTAVIPQDQAFLSNFELLSAFSKKKIGSLSVIALSCSASCNPFISGNEKSRIAKSGDYRFVLTNASAPFRASIQALNPLPL